MTLQTSIDHLHAAASEVRPPTTRDGRSGAIIRQMGELRSLPAAETGEWAAIGTVEAAADSAYGLVQRLLDIDEETVVGADTHPTTVSKLAALALAMTRDWPHMGEGYDRLSKVAHRLLADERVVETDAQEVLIVAAEMVRTAARRSG